MKRIALTLVAVAAVTSAAPAAMAAACEGVACYVSVAGGCDGGGSSDPKCLNPICIDWSRPAYVYACTPDRG